MAGRRSRATTIEPQTESANGAAEHSETDELQGLDPMDRMPECGAMAAWGVRCTKDAFHDSSHSWGGEQSEILKPDHTKSCAFILSEGGDECDCGASEGRPSGSIEHGTEVLRAEAGARQTTLPGTSESEPLAEPDDYSVPLESQFNGRDLMDAPGLRTIGTRLIEQEDAFEHLRGVELGWFWKRRGGTQGGNPRYGGIKRPDAFVKHYSGSAPIYLAWLASDHVRDAKFEPRQIEAQIFSLLCRTDVDPDDHDAYRLVGPDFVGFVLEIERFGAWSADLREAAARIQQLPLVEVAAADVDAASADAEDDE
jgi:hypothetical protein